MTPLKPGSLAITVKRADARNADLVVEILAHLGPLPALRIADGYRVRRIDGHAIPSAITYGPDGQIREADSNAMVVAIADRRFLRPIEGDAPTPNCVRFLRRPDRSDLR